MPTKEVHMKSTARWRGGSKRTPKTWPQLFGFTVTSGSVPCYVTSVERGSPAHRAGICPGDQIVEIDGRNVADMSADNIRALASTSLGSEVKEVTVPPKIGVVSRVQYLELTASDVTVGYGLTMSGVRPTVVQQVDPVGPAHRAGVRSGMLLCN